MGVNDIPKIQIFRPTIEDMKNFSKYLEYMEAEGANKAGLAKIIPPPEWIPRKGSYEDRDVLDMVIKYPIQQIVQGKQGLYQQFNMQKKSLTVREFKKLAESTRYKTPEYFDYEDLERKYWKNVSYNAPIYGADVPGTLYDKDVDSFNINHLNTILDLVDESYGIKIMGVNTAYLYFGMWKTTFAWHTEDMDLYSINYLHFGAPKSWYAIPPEHGRRLERLAAGFFPSSAKSCPAFLRHKMTLISPQVLKQYSIPFNKITQEPGEFMITFPYAYHAGYNHGYNCAESTNFALQRWVEYGKRASKCLCRSDSVKISMETFVKKFQPDRYDLWLQGKDIGPHPEDPSHISAAPPPTDYELQVLSKVSKSKRHPPFRRDSFEDSDTEAYDSDNSCNDKVASVPTKAAKKIFSDSFDNSNSSNESQDLKKDEGYLKTSPPHFEETFKDLHHQAIRKKRKRSQSEASECDSSHSSKKPLCCTKPNPALDSMSWPIYSNPAMPIEVEEIFEKLQEQSRPIAPSWEDKKEFQQSISKINRTESSTCRSSSPLHSNGTVPPPPLFCYSHNHKSPFYSPFPENKPLHQLNGSQSLPLPPPPPLKQHHTRNLDAADSCASPYPQIHLNSDSNHVDQITSNGNQSNSLTPLSRTFLRRDEDKKSGDPEFVFEGVQQLVELPAGKAEACTSTDDLLVNEIIVKTKTVQSSELLKLVHSGNSNADVKKLLTCVPVPLHLYQHLPYNYFGEQLHNSSLSSIYPHCSICILLKKFEIHNEWPCAEPLIPSSSPVLIPKAAFAFKVIDQNTTLDEIKTSPLLVCIDCKICVHAVCYGVVNKPLMAKWKCDRCEQKKYGATCSLCPLRGGALKQSEDPNVWAHIICVLMQPDAKFQNGISKSPVDISGVKKTKGVTTLRCTYCQKSNKPLAEYIAGYCIQCYKSPKCSAAFHVTCAQLAGAVFEANDWPDPIRAFCKKCISTSEKRRNDYIDSKQEDDVKIDMTVIAKHKNSRYYHAKVVFKEEQLFHHVHFVDNSFSENVRSSDFVSHNIDEVENIETGDQVQVLWNKEHLTGKYSGRHVVPIYTLMFEDNSRVKARRVEFYSLDQPLPKKVESKLSMATEQKHNSLFVKSEKTAKYLKD